MKENNPNIMIAGNLERVLAHTDKTIDFRKDMEAIELVCNYEFEGSTSLRDLHILVIYDYISLQSKN